MAVTKTSDKKKGSKPVTAEAYLAALPAEKRAVMAATRKFVSANVPKGFVEHVGWGINWAIPLSEFADTYNGQPLAYVAITPNKNNFSLHLMAAYWQPKEIAFLKDEFKKAGKRFDMGMACLRFKELDDLELKSVAKVIKSVSKKEYLANYKKVKGLK
jgi:hypothetical protein